METRVPRSKTWKHLGAAAAGVAATAAGLIAFAPPAAAHYAPIWHGNDLGQVTSSHTTVSIYDGECDGNTVFIQYQANGESFVRQTMDLNGCSTGGQTVNLPSGRRVYRARVCETNVGCTSWRAH